MNNPVIIGLLVAALLVGTLLFIQAERSPVAEAPGPSSEIAEEKVPRIVPETEIDQDLLRVATSEDLSRFPEVAQEAGLPEGRLYAVRLPQTDLFIVLRPLTESEYASFQVKAVGYEIIEREMLAAAFVLPKIAEPEVASFPPELVSFLQERVNRISGFGVFP